MPNTQVSPVTLGHPGTLPVMNRKAIELAVKMGLACHCEIVRQNYFARKNYFYPDLPKGYQVSQHSTPICKNGFLTIHTQQGEKKIRINRIHLEEDAGKSLHDAEEENTCIDYNRAGIPLIEMVTEPDLRGGEEAYACLSEIRKRVRYLEISDGNMEEGSFRCDANISVRKRGETKLGIKTEVKNLNSFRNIKKAIDTESGRMIEILERGGHLVQETRSYDDVSGTTFPVREKEEADDYRYFPEPDLVPFHLQEGFIENIRSDIPALPEERIRKYMLELQLSEYDASLLAEEKPFSDYFERLIACLSLHHSDGSVTKAKPAANWMLGPVRSWLNEQNKDITALPLHPDQLAVLIQLVESGQLSFSVAAARLFPQLLHQPDKNPGQLADELNLLKESDRSVISPIIDSVLEKYADKVLEYKKGKKGLLALFIGEVIKRSKGKADPEMTRKMILEKLKS